MVWVEGAGGGTQGGGADRRPVTDAREEGLLKLLHRWRTEAGQAGRGIKRIAVAYEAGRDGFWLARWLQARDVEAYVIPFGPRSRRPSRRWMRFKCANSISTFLRRCRDSS
jgi:transposase